MSVTHLVESAKSKGYHAIALTDAFNMHGVMHFILACKKHNVKPLIGATLACDINQESMPFVMIAKNLEGYRQLSRCVTMINQPPYHLTLEDLKTNHDQCVIITLSEGGWFETDMVEFNTSNIAQKASFLQENFNDVYVGLSMQESLYWKEKNSFLKPIVLAQNIQTVALSKVYYDSVEDDQTLLVLQAIKSQKSVRDPSLILKQHRHLLSVDEMIDLYDVDDCEASDEIASKVEIYELSQLTTLPQYQSNESVDNKTYLQHLCMAGLKKRYRDQSDLSLPIQRLNHELEVILEMNYQDYFLIVFDIIVFAKKQNIAVGPGRGSAAGSLVSYCLGITHIDPLKHGLLFERFLNSQRISMPDIDIDFADNRRDEIIDYVFSKYGHQHVAHILTFGTLKAKMSLRDVAKVFDVPLKVIETLIKNIPSKPNTTLTQAFAQSTSFAKLIKDNQQLQDVFDMALKIENFPRHTSTHAAGVVFSKQPLMDVLPLIQIESDMLSTQYTMEFLEPLGLIKMDFLGLRNLTIIEDVLDMIEEPIDILKLPLDDQKTYQLIRQGDTTGIFQLESEGMKRLIVQMKPDRFDDIVATIALYRPGPMENIPLYLEAKHKQQTTFNVHEKLKPIVADTYGILIYQEQILQAVVALANFSLAKADLFRKAISKKNSKEFQQLQADFIKGAIANGIAEQEAISLFELIGKFANYGFNKSHAVAYGLISYQMAYLKANYPSYFYCALLNGVIGSEGKTIEYLYECRKKKITLYPMSIFESKSTYQLKPDGLLLPLSIIKGIGTNAVEQLVKERELNGPFVDLFDFVARMMVHRFNTKTFEALIYAGACDDFKLKRLDMIASLDDALNFGNLVKIETEDHVQIDLNLVSKPIMMHVKDQPLHTLEKEKEVLGFYLSNHPIVSIKSKLNLPITSITSLNDSQAHNLCVMIDRFKAIKTKRGEWMAFVTFSDDSATIEAILWPQLYKQMKDSLEKSRVFIVKGHMDQKKTFIVSNMSEVDQKEVL